MSVVVCSLGDSFQRLPLNFKVTSYEIGHSLPSLEWTQKNKFKELRAVFRKQWKRAIVDLTSKTARILSHICTLNFAEERWGRCLYISWFQYGPPSQEGSCTSTYFGVPVYYPPNSYSTLPFTSFNTSQCKSNNKQGGTLPTHPVPKGIVWENSHRMKQSRLFWFEALPHWKQA